MSTTNSFAQYLKGSATVIVIVAVFAAVWGTTGSIALAGISQTIALLTVIFVTVLMMAGAYSFFRAAQQVVNIRRQTLSPLSFNPRPYWIAVIGQAVAIPLVSRLLSLNGYPDAIMPAVVAIVGLHFFGLIPAWRFAGVGGAMVLLALISLGVPVQIILAGTEQTIGSRVAFLGLGCAIILWLSMLPLIISTRSQIKPK
jgi:hypothetical protein